MASSEQQVETYQAPTGILTGPIEDNGSKLTQPAVVLMNLTWIIRKFICRRNLVLTFLEECHSVPRRSLNIFAKLSVPSYRFQWTFRLLKGAYTGKARKGR